MEPWININALKYPGAGSIAEGIQTSLNNEQGSQLLTRPEVTDKYSQFAMDLVNRDLKTIGDSVILGDYSEIPEGLKDQKIKICSLNKAFDGDYILNDEI